MTTFNKKSLLISILVISGITVLLAILYLKNSSETIDTPPIPISKTIPPEESENYTYQITKENLVQTINLIRENSQLEFQIETGGAEITNQSQQGVRGIAYLTEVDNSAIITDEAGFGHVADEYVYKEGDCWVYFRIDRETKTRLSIKTSPECQQSEGELSNFVPIGQLKLVVE